MNELNDIPKIWPFPTYKGEPYIQPKSGHEYTYDELIDSQDSEEFEFGLF